MTTDLGQRWWSTLVRPGSQNFGLVLAMVSSPGEPFPSAPLDQPRSRQDER
jgi:hypothetical protein